MQLELIMKCFDWLYANKFNILATRRWMNIKSLF